MQGPMAGPTTSLTLMASRADQIFPTLTPAQIRRITPHGRARLVNSGVVLVEQGANDIPIFVVISGELQTVRPSRARETLIATGPPGQFTRAVHTLSGRRALNRIPARHATEAIEISRDTGLAL